MGGDSGGGSATPVSQPSNTSSTQLIQYQPYVEKQLEPLTTRSVTESNVDRIAPADASTETAWNDVINSMGLGTTQMNNAATAYGNAATPLNQLDYSSYMNPYTKNVLSNQIDLMNRQYAQQNNAVNSQATMAGAYGGSRSDLLNATNRDTENRQISDMISQGYGNAYTNAQQLALQNANLQSQYGSNELNLANQYRNANSSDIQALANVGQQKQTQQQTLNDQERANISFLESALKGVATPSTTTSTSYTPIYTYTNPTMQNLGGLTSLLGMF